MSSNVPMVYSATNAVDFCRYRQLWIIYYSV